MASNKGPGLYEFLIESELQQYYAGIKNDLKIQNVAQLKYAAEEDLHQIGMSKPEMRRLRKYFQKHYPQNYLLKFKKLLLTRRDDQPSFELVLPDDTRNRQSVKIPNKHMIPVESIIVNKELGQGEFGVVQQGVWTNDGDRIQVAIKCLSRERMQNNPIEFLKEAAIMHAIDHEHIVRLYGCVLDSNALMLVTELAPLRSLLECLKEPSLRASFPVLSLCDFAIQVCDGMQYLEMKRLIHRDLAARNILVFSKHKVKISDFGLSRALGVGKDYYQTNFNVNLKLPIAWCAPECISYLRFTSASDVWAYGVTLWEMFSYGFQPWAALTGHQILEAIDQPNFQRLEQPECCPKDYFSLMLKCWQHDPNKRPRFVDLAATLPESKPEQVKAVEELSGDAKPRDQLQYRLGDIITVLDKGNMTGCWKGALNNGKTGLFNPAHTVAYLGADLPSSKPGEFVRGDGKNAFSSRRRLRTDMISSPQGDVKHTSHVGLDGAYFGDVAFLDGKCPVPQQVVTPYKPQEDADGHSLLTPTCSDTSDRAPLLKATGGGSLQPAATKLLTDHEYHEITDEEDIESPRSEKSFDFGPSLLDEMDAVFRSLGGSPPPSPGLPPPLDETVNVRNELKEMAAKVTSKKKQITVKPISASDQRTLDSAIAMATELAARSMNDLDGASPPESPRTPTTPGKRKFSFRFPTPTLGSHNGNKTEKRSFSDESASITDVQSSISAAAREVYSSLVEQRQSSLSSSSPPLVDTNPLRLLRSKAFPVVRPRVRGNKHNPAKLRVPPAPTAAPPPVPTPQFVGHPAPLSREFSSAADNQERFGVSHYASGGFPYGQNDAMAAFEVKSIRAATRRDSHEGEGEGELDEENPIPLPPRDRTLPLPPSKQRHQRRHPLLMPGLAALTLGDNGAATAGEDAQLTSNADDVQTPAEKDVHKSLNDSFEHRIACELEAALDDMPEYDSTLTETVMHHHGDDTTLNMHQRGGDTTLNVHNPGDDTTMNMHHHDDDTALNLRRRGDDATLSMHHHSDDTALNMRRRGDDTSFSARRRGDDMALNDATLTEATIRHRGDHVSCEDLLEFACDTPNAKRTRGKARGVSSDEVRIMGKVLGVEVSREDCLNSLNASDWDVYRAIKLARLYSLLRGSQNLALCNQALDSCAGDVASAASWVMANQDLGDATHV